MRETPIIAGRVESVAIRVTLQVEIGRAARYNRRLIFRAVAAMEAERLNQIAASLTGLRERAADLRRYL